jgi:hypothetical protein
MDGPGIELGTSWSGPWRSLDLKPSFKSNNLWLFPLNLKVSFKSEGILYFKKRWLIFLSKYRTCARNMCPIMGSHTKMMMLAVLWLVGIVKHQQHVSGILLWPEAAIIIRCIAKCECLWQIPSPGN